MGEAQRQLISLGMVLAKGFEEKRPGLLKRACRTPMSDVTEIQGESQKGKDSKKARTCEESWWAKDDNEE